MKLIHLNPFVNIFKRLLHFNPHLSTFLILSRHRHVNPIRLNKSRGLVISIKERFFNSFSLEVAVAGFII